MAQADVVAEKLASQDWEAVTKRLLVLARARLRTDSLERAKEVVQEALTRIWDPAYKDWNPTEQPDLLEHLGSVVNGIIRNIHASPVERGTRVHEPDVVDKIAESVRPGHARLDERVHAREVMSMLLKRTENQARVFEVLLLMSEGIDKASVQAQKLGCPVTEVYKARRRLTEHVEALRAELAKGVDHGT